MSHSPAIQIMTDETNHALFDGLVVPSLPRIDSASESGDIDNDNTQPDDDTEDFMFHRNVNRCSTSESHAYNLQPPPPFGALSHAEYLADRLFSHDHLNIILKDTAHLQRFTNFLIKYQPQNLPTLVRYLDSQKAIKAIQYANALAKQTFQPLLLQKANAATINPMFTQLSQQALETLVKEALPRYITFGLVDIVTEMVDKEIIGRHSPLPHEAIQGLAEVYCISDPTQPGNPIVFASEEFFSTTQYGINHVIGRNCRFLQGPKTSRTAIERIKMAVEEREEISEIVLNYRRDGSPFFNLIMVAPLNDNKGSLRYYIGCQIDVTKLIEGGKGINTFRQLLARDRSKPATPALDPLENKHPLKALRELGSLLSDEELETIRDGDRSRVESRPALPKTSKQPRRFVGLVDRVPPDSLCSKQLVHFPGVYQNYILVRPYPSLRIVFTSPTLHVPGLCQSNLEDHIGGPEHVRDSLVDALAQGIGVTAKVSWLAHVPKQSKPHSSLPVDDDASYLTADSYLAEGKPYWIHCTPLLGSNRKIGVIMIVIVDGETNTSSLQSTTKTLMPTPATINSTTAGRGESRSRRSVRFMDHGKECWPVHDSGLGGASHRLPLAGLPVPRTPSGGSKMYAEYLKREAREAQQRSGSFNVRNQEREERLSGLGYTVATAKEETRSSVPSRPFSKLSLRGKGTF